MGSKEIKGLIATSLQGSSADESRSEAAAGEDETGVFNGSFQSSYVDANQTQWSSQIKATVSLRSSSGSVEVVLKCLLQVLSHIISQLRPGADLSRVVLPTFILEPRSMLERITK